MSGIGIGNDSAKLNRTQTFHSYSYPGRLLQGGGAELTTCIATAFKGEWLIGLVLWDKDQRQSSLVF